MVFSSNVFLLYFMPVFFLVYFALPKKTRNYVLLFASIIFYAWGAPEFLIQLLLSIIANFYLVGWMCRTDRPGLKKLLCGLSIAIPIGLLLYYKYAGFLMGNLNAILVWLGTSQLSTLNSHLSTIILPIGISFFSFQSVTYTLDTYRGVNPPMKRLSDFMLYITMFPQLIAGPIVRYCDVADQIRNRESTMDDRLMGFYRFVIGLSKKVLIADVIGASVDAVLGQANLSVVDAHYISVISGRIAALDTGSAWIIALGYTMQIYFDFAGYSDMAIGLGRIMGFKFPENFDNPYTSKSITEFWRRWHMTLGTFIKNYLYIPLGGNRKGTGRMYFNLWLCFLLSGLWHGASWNFVVWGAYHGFFIAIEKLWKVKGERLKVKGIIRRRSPFTFQFSIFTFLIVMLGWVVFRIERFDLAWAFIKRLFAFEFSAIDFTSDLRLYATLVIAVIFSFITLTKFGKRLQDWVYAPNFSDGKHVLAWIVAAIGFLACIASMNTAGFSPFIYFRF